MAKVGGVVTSAQPTMSYRTRISGSLPLVGGVCLFYHRLMCRLVPDPRDNIHIGCVRKEREEGGRFRMGEEDKRENGQEV